MKNKLVFRILGALASALIIVSVFIPFISVTGYSQSLWEAHSSVGTLYLPTMIIVFGAIGVLVFSTNFKTELAYTSSGALLFFSIMQTIPIIDQGTFNTLSVGYYCLVVGTVLTGIMAFLCNLRTKKKVVEELQDTQSKEISMINQIDKLYENQTIMDSQETNSLDNIIQPLQVENNLVNDVNPIPVQNNLGQSMNQNTIVQNPIPSIVANDMDKVEASISLQNLSNQVVEQPTMVVEPVQQPNVNVSNPVISEFQVPSQNTNMVQSAPVMPQFDSVQPIEQNISVGQNPVLAEFNNSVPQFTSMQSVVNQPDLPVLEPVTSLNNENRLDKMAESSNNSNNNLDIFG